jgi:hypothetical protein
MFVLSEYVYFISSYYIFVEPFRLKQMQKKTLIEKKQQNNGPSLPIYIFPTNDLRLQNPKFSK